MGMATIICDVTSGLGVITAAIIKITTTACLRYLRINAGVMSVMRDKKYTYYK